MRQLSEHSDQSASTTAGWKLLFAALLIGLLTSSGCTIYSEPNPVAPSTLPVIPIHLNVDLHLSRLPVIVSSPKTGPIIVFCSLNGHWAYDNRLQLDSLFRSDMGISNEISQFFVKAFLGYLYAEKHVVDALNGRPLAPGLTVTDVDLNPDFSNVDLGSINLSESEASAANPIRGQSTQPTVAGQGLSLEELLAKTDATENRPWQPLDGSPMEVDLDRLALRDVKSGEVESLDTIRNLVATRPSSTLPAGTLPAITYHWQPLTPDAVDILYEKLDAKFGIERAFGGQKAATQPATQPTPTTGPLPSTQPMTSMISSSSTMPLPTINPSPATNPASGRQPMMDTSPSLDTLLSK